MSSLNPGMPTLGSLVQDLRRRCGTKLSRKQPTIQHDRKRGIAGSILLDFKLRYSLLTPNKTSGPSERIHPGGQALFDIHYLLFFSFLLLLRYLPHNPINFRFRISDLGFVCYLKFVICYFWLFFSAWNASLGILLPIQSGQFLVVQWLWVRGWVQMHRIPM